MQTLAKCLKAIDNLIRRIVEGTVTYSEIVAQDEKVLKKLDIEREFGILLEYAGKGTEGLEGVRSLLEIFKCTDYVKDISSVCEQYHLEARNDPSLKEVKELTQQYAEEKDRFKITSGEAIKNLKRVKEILQIETSLKCLEIFEGIGESAEFRKFVMERHFHGPHGQDLFLQQYELITAQLLHEDYDEAVLNHLRAAFDVMIPFTDNQKSFEKLMSEVTALRTENGLEGLKTVNRNITLIRSWFSRAEVRFYLA